MPPATSPPSTAVRDGSEPTGRCRPGETRNHESQPRTWRRRRETTAEEEADGPHLRSTPATNQRSHLVHAADPARPAPSAGGRPTLAVASVRAKLPAAVRTRRPDHRSARPTAAQAATYRLTCSFAWAPPASPHRAAAGLALPSRDSFTLAAALRRVAGRWPSSANDRPPGSRDPGAGIHVSFVCCATCRYVRWRDCSRLPVTDAELYLPPVSRLREQRVAFSLPAATGLLLAFLGCDRDRARFSALARSPFVLLPSAC